MYDINFFSVYKKKKAKGSGLKTFLIVFLGLFVLMNILLLGLYLLTTNGMEKDIAANQAKINDPKTKEKIAEAFRINQEYTLTDEYLKLLQNASSKLSKMDLIDKPLLDEIRAMTPTLTHFKFTEYDGINVTLDCVSSSMTDPMDMYHAFVNNPIFASVTLSGINAQSDGTISFGLTCQLAGGDQK
jgi:hypothetical protein